VCDRHIVHLLLDDPEDSKPENWVEIAEIDDPDATKVSLPKASVTCRDIEAVIRQLTSAQPDDWDEDAPLMITDTSATKPADWLDDEPELIPDPEADKPEEWDVSIVFGRYPRN